MSEMIPLIEEIADDRPGLQIFHATIVLRQEPGQPARRGASTPRRRPRQRLLRCSTNNTWLAAQVLWTIAVVRSRHRPAATVLYERLLPWHEQFATTHITVHGAVAHYLGLLAHTLDRHDEADRWFGQALALHEAMEAPFFVAFTQTAWAELLTDRDRPGDSRRARALGEAALRVANSARVRPRRTRRSYRARTDRMMGARRCVGNDG